MRFVLFRTPKPKSFSYRPRYYDPEKEEWQRKKAARGLNSELTHRESLRLEMSKKWRKEAHDPDNSKVTKVIVYSFYIFFIAGSIYVIMFTDFVEKLLALFGVTGK